MKLRQITQLFSIRDLRNSIIAVVVIGGGLGLSFLTIYARFEENSLLATISAISSLVFVVLLLVFVVPPLARNAGKEASQMNLPFEFTFGGAIMLGLIVVVGFSAWNTRNNLLFLILSLLAAAVFVGFIAGNSGLKKLDVRMRFPETIFAGEETRIIVNLQNRKRIFPSYSIVAEVRGTDRERSSAASELKEILPTFLAERLARPPLLRRTLNYFAYVPRNSGVEETVRHIFDDRGRFLIKDFELSTRFPFGFFRHRRRLTARETELIVFPKLEPIDNDLEEMLLDSGRLTANKRGLGQDLLALRDYQPNDDLRRIDWKATARTRNLTVREFTAEDEKRVVIFFDTRVRRDSNEPSLREKIEAEQSGRSIERTEQFEGGVSLTAALLAHFTEQEAELRLVIDAEDGENGFGTRHLYDCLKRLSGVDANICRDDEKLDRWDAPETALSGLEESHNFLITCLGYDVPTDLAERLKIIRF